MVWTSSSTKTKGTSFIGNLSPGPARIGRLPSTCSTTLWKPRDGDDIPSDDSDPGERGSSFGARPRPRTRARRGTITGTSLHNGVPWNSQRGTRADFSIANSTATSHVPNNNSINERDNITNKPGVSSLRNPLLAHRSSTKPSNQWPYTSNGSGSSLIARWKQNKAAQISDKEKQSLQTNSLITAANRLGEECSRQVQLPKNHTNSNYNVKEWLFYTVWYPAWDIIWKCDNGRVPLTENRDFCKLINDVLFDNAGPDLNGSYDLNVVKVQNVQTEDDECTVVGTVELNYQKKKKIKWKPTPIIIGRLLKAVLSSGDIIVQCVPKGRVARKICFVHITFKDGDKVDFCDLFDGVNVHVVLYQIKYEHYVPTIVKCMPFSTKPDVNEEQAIPIARVCAPAVTRTLPVTSSRVRTDTSISLVQSVDSSAKTNKDSTAVNGDANSSKDGNLTTVSSGLVNAGQDDQVDASDENNHCSSINFSSNASQYVNGNRGEIRFDLDAFIQNGNFVPGPLRPKVKKSERNIYVYNTLAELSALLNESIAEDVRKNVVPNMLIKHQCHAYGVVDEIVPQFRHGNAYFVRVSDETMNSVLLRIHTNSNEENAGPVVDAGKIIRIHRLTVQMEWDAGVGDNTMVLSTPSHCNYVLFEQSNEENKFYYNSCAKSITLDERDMKRVGELHLFKSKRSFTHNDEVQSVVEHNIINDRDRDTHLQLNSASSAQDCDTDTNTINRRAQTPFSQSEGICPSDLASPPLTCESNINGNAESSALSLDFNMQSDDSFFSAASQFGNDRLDSQNSVLISEGINQEEQSVSEVASDHLQNRTNPLDLYFTLFRDLTKTDVPLNLLCQIIALCGSSNESEYQLVIKDVEQSVAPDDFKFNELAPDLRKRDGYLVVNVTNAETFETRNIFSLILDSLGTDEVFSIEDVRVIGDEPPYKLVVDGNVCEIKRYPHMLKYFQLEDTFSSTPESEATAGNNFNDAPKNQCEDILLGQKSKDTNAHPNNDGGDGENTNDTLPELSEGSSDVTALQSSSHGHETTSNRKRTHANDDTSTNARWTGRLRGRRKPREHYQSEESLQC